MVKIGDELPKLSPNKSGYPFFGPLCSDVMSYACWRLYFATPIIVHRLLFVYTLP